MKYIFTDIESVKDNPGIIELGYIVTDEQFNILIKKLFKINPKLNFEFLDKRQKNMSFVHLCEIKRNFLFFDELYEDIKCSLELKDAIVFSYELDKYISYLQKDCQRYQLDPINFNGYDLSKIFDDLSSKKDLLTKDVIKDLKTIENIKTLNLLETTFIQMKLFKNYISLNNITVNEFIKDNQKLNSLEFVETFDQETKNKTKKEREEDKWVLGRKFIKEFAIYDKFVKDSPEAFGKRYAIAFQLSKDHVQLYNLLLKLKECGFLIVEDPKDADYIVVNNENKLLNNNETNQNTKVRYVSLDEVMKY